MVSAADIVATASWDLALNRYKEIKHEEVEHTTPAKIILELRTLETEISNGLGRLEEMLG